MHKNVEIIPLWGGGGLKAITRTAAVKNRAVLQNKNKVKIIGKSVKYLVLIEFFLVENNTDAKQKLKYYL